VVVGYVFNSMPAFVGVVPGNSAENPEYFLKVNGF
jgi:hypothetical protein